MWETGGFAQRFGHAETRVVEHENALVLRLHQETTHPLLDADHFQLTSHIDRFPLQLLDSS